MNIEEPEDIYISKTISSSAFEQNLTTLQRTVKFYMKFLIIIINMCHVTIVQLLYENV